MTVLTPEKTTPFELEAEKNGSPHSPTYITLDDYWAFYYEHPDHNYEYNNGLLEEVTVAKKLHVEMFTWFLALLRRYLEVQPIATLSMLEIGFKIEQPGKVQVRKPDLGVVLRSNPIPFEDEDHRYHGIFDLCVEMVSDSSRKEIERDTIIKLAEYEAAGVKEYWLLSDDKAILGVYRLNNRGKYQKVTLKTDGVWRSSVLPGFCLRVADLFAMPSLNDLVDDPLYTSFAFPKFQQERQLKQDALEQVQQEQQRTKEAELRAEMAEKRAEQEHKQAKEERLAKEKLAEFLRQQGFDPESLL